MTAPKVSCALTMPNQDHLFEHVKANAKYAKHMCEPNMAKGKRLALCGAGPSLNPFLDELKSGFWHQVWACNSAVPYLKNQGVRVTHGFAIDQGIEMLQDWAETYDIQYLIASSVHPELVQYLLKANRRVRWFHNYLGIENPEGWTPPQANLGYEMWLYQTLYKPSVQVGYGLNSVPRAICLALWLGFKHIDVYGADCAGYSPDAGTMPATAAEDYPAWLDKVQLYADGRTALINGPGAIMVEGDIDGRLWHTRADMLITARHMRDLKRAFPDRITLKGDTLPNAIMDKDDEWMNQMPNLTGAGEISGFALIPNPPLTTPQEAE